ncbi:MAG: GTP cyclohydrolase I FolE [bacterium]
MFDTDKIKTAVRMFLEAVGEDLEREGLRETPERVARMCGEIFAGLQRNPREELKVFHEEKHEEMILVRDIPLYSICEHHLLPFFGKAHVAYIPRQGMITGLSKLARVVDTVARRPQVQERLTGDVADLLMEMLNPYGVAVVIEAEHMCMTMRGINKPGSLTVTSALRGIFRQKEVTRAEFFSLIRGKGVGA